MHRPIFGRSFALLVAPILLSVLAFKFLNKKKTSVRKNVKDADAATSGSLTAPKETDSDGSSLFPTKTNNGASYSSTTSTGNYYEVFLNFRGQDTRRGFTDHLYNGLVDAGIFVFKDDNELRQGEKIGPDLLTAIKNSKILIPIISVNYGQSRWCLDELVQIMECKKSNLGYTVLPIFYKVEPSHVRFQSGSFGDAFRTRSKHFDSTTLEKWKQALDEVSSLKGFDANGYEGELVKLVVQQVLFELKKKFELVIPENLVGIDSHVKNVMKFVENISCASLFIGIHGMGGIGKTTLAKSIYNKLSNQFELRSFIADVRETCDDRRLVYLQNQLIKDILKLKNQVSNKDEGIQVISSKFNGKKLLILLDDVSNDDQLKALVGNHNWFSSGSVIIITTRNKSILDNAGVDNQYELEELDKDNSSILFSRHAFRRDSPPSEFKDLTHVIVSTTGGLPLSLQVLGSFLCGKKENVWGDTIKKLRKFPHEEVQKKLRISYKELTNEQKQIFLDIACFFIGVDQRIASYMWDACEFFPKEGIEVLRFLSLIKVGDDHELIMHDQLRDLGREIVRRENNLEPWNRSRLWDSEAVLEVLEGNKGTSKIEAIHLGLYDGSGSCTTETFRELTNLRFLQLDDVNLIGDFQNLLPRLRWLAWDGYPLHFELTNFHLKKLVVLNLSHSEILNDWAGFGPLKMAMGLKVLNLSYCALRTTPDLSAFKGLEILILEDCHDLKEIHPSITDIKTLVSLNVNYCWNLKELPREVGRMEELRELLILNTGIEELPESIGSLKKLETLDAYGCESLACNFNSIGNLISLSRLDLTNCHKLVQLPNSIGSLMSLQQLFLSKCYSLRQIPDSIGKLTSLIMLDLNFTDIEELPESIGSLKELKILDASNCKSLALIPNSIGDLASLSYLNLTNCHKLVQLPNSIGFLVSLPQLLLSGCHSLRQIPDSIGKLTSLIELHLKSTAIEELPESIGSLKELETLDASYCASLARIPNSIGNSTSLSRLDLTECHKLAQLPDSIGFLVSLQELLLSGCHSLRQIPDSIGKLISLIELHLKYTAIEELPESIGSLKELETLDASYCASLAYIPNSIGNSTSLSCLDLTECHKLAQLPDSIGFLVSLPRLSLSGCHLLRQIPYSIGKLTSLIRLHLKSTAIEELPESIGSLKELETLDASYCESLARIPNSIGNSTSLSRLDLTGCHKLAQLPDSIGFLVSLQQLLLSGCHSLRQIPDSIGKLTSLTELHLKSTAIKELPESIGNIQNLSMLDISGTPIIELLDDPGILAKLQEFRASGWKNSEGSPSNNGQLVSPNNLGLEKLQKLSELRSRILALVLLKHPRTPAADNSAMDYQTADFEHVLERSRPFGISDEVNNLPVNILPVSYNCPSLSQSSYSSNDLPRNVVITLSQGSLVKSMDFHQVKQILLLVGTNTGDVMVWEVGSGARIALRKFKIWDLGTCSMALQASLANDYTASVNRVMWSPDGILFGVAYSKHMVHIYSYHGGDDMRNHLEIEAHVGSVNDLAFSNPSKQLCFVTCGEDKTIKVWDAVTGAKLLAFKGHEAPVYSICPHNRENIQYVFSTATDGKIKGWLYDNMVSRVDWDAPGHSSTVMAYNADGTRLFSCGTNKEGESYLVEWNESEGAVKRTYHGLGKRSGGVVQFDTTKNRFLAVGDEFTVKFWDMDNNNILICANADGGLPASPCIRFNQEGNLLAVSTSDKSIKILANADGIRLLRTMDNRPFDASRITLGPLMKDGESMADVKPGIADESGDKSRIWRLTEIKEPLQCRSIRLPDDSTATRVSRLIYTNSGLAILALSSNAVHKLWKWGRSDRNLTGRATTSVVPQLWQPASGIFMTNDVSDTIPEDAVPCFALSKNDSYVISASGGKISLLNMMTFKKMTTFSPSPPLPPNNDVVAIGMEDSTIQIYSGQVDEIQKKLKRCQRIIKGFAFSTSLHVLVSSGADSQTMTTFTPPPPRATFLAFYPQDNNIIAIGMEDSSIHIYYVRVDEFKANLKGHQKRITSLAFSNVLNVLVSSGADSQLCVWSNDGWEKQASQFLQMPTGLGATPLAGTRVQFHVDQIHLLVVHETQIATYEAPKLECVKQWVPPEASGPITDATYSCNGQSIYVSFEDGSIGVLTTSTLKLRCRINPAAYIRPKSSFTNYPFYRNAFDTLRVYPLVIAAHPSEPNQFALGLTDGSVYVLEPLESKGEWGDSSLVENGAGPSTTSGTTDSNQPQ